MSTGDFRVADISLADFGRKEIELAEHEVCFDKLLQLLFFCNPSLLLLTIDYYCVCRCPV